MTKKITIKLHVNHSQWTMVNHILSWLILESSLKPNYAFNIWLSHKFYQFEASKQQLLGKHN